MIKKKILLKSITWRITATTTTMLIVYLLTGEWRLAGSAAVVEIIIKTIIYYLHESLWEKVEDNDELIEESVEGVVENQSI